MKTQDLARKGITLPLEMARELDDFRFERRFRTDAEAIRVLISKGLEAFRKEAERTEGGARA